MKLEISLFPTADINLNIRIIVQSNIKQITVDGLEIYFNFIRGGGRALRLLEYIYISIM